MAAEPRGSDRLHHRLLGADRLDHRVRAEPVGEVRDPRDAVVPSLLDDVGRAELQGELLPGQSRLIAMILSAPSCLAASTPSSSPAP